MIAVRGLSGTIGAVLVFVSLDAVSYLVIDLDAKRGDDEIGYLGIGFIWIAIEMLVALVWAGIDRLRGRRLKLLPLRWVTVSFTLAVVQAVHNQMGPEPPYWTAFMVDIVTAVMINVLLIGGVASIGWSLGAAIQRHRAQRNG